MQQCPAHERSIASAEGEARSLAILMRESVPKAATIISAGSLKTAERLASMVTDEYGRVLERGSVALSEADYIAIRDGMAALGKLMAASTEN